MLPFRRKKEKRPLSPKPAWLKWLILAFVLYALVVANSPSHVSTKRTLDTAKNNLEQIGEEQFSGYKEKIFPEHNSSSKVKEIAEGTGAPAVCGQKVAITYESFLAQGNALPDTASKEKPLRFTIGSGHTMPVFDRGVIGMKIGGKRSIVAPPLMSYGLENFRRDDIPKGVSVRVEIEMLAIEPTLPDTETTPYRIAEVALGNGSILLCGEKARVHLTLWDISGKSIYTTPKDAPITITPGASEVMLGLEQGIIGMREGGRRLLIIPPSFQNTMNGNKPKLSLPLPANQTLMAEVMAYGS